MNTNITTSLLLAAALGFTACQKKEAQSATDTAPAAVENPELQKFLLAEKPADPVNVSTLFAQPDPGREVTVRGLVMGKMQVFVDSRAMFVIGDDTKLTHCAAMEDDHCETPWDVCCEDPDDIKKAIATVQLTDADGTPLKSSLKGLAGLKELSEVTLTGTLAPGSNAENLVINATGLHIQP
ncbi:MAG: hypothetical protein ACQKBY_04240 [Verrucomicrobiales bacterium]